MIKIKNWSKHQSYKDRRPPWIRFHRSILDDYKFQSMSADSRALLPMLWLLACEHEDPTSGVVDCSMDEITFRLRQREDIINDCLSELQDADFIERIESVTNPLQNSNENVTPETEERQSRGREEHRQKRLSPDDFPLPDFVDRSLWIDFMEIRRKKKAVQSESALKSIVKKLEVMGDDANESLRTSIESSWKSVFPPNHTKKPKDRIQRSGFEQNKYTSEF